jgi:beta-lactamase superfamily II metal-dependent hydrolase
MKYPCQKKCQKTSHTKEGTNFFFDGGSTDVSKVGTYRMLPFLKAKGVKKIDYWIVSHTDADHISGLKEQRMDSGRKFTGCAGR